MNTSNQPTFRGVYTALVTPMNPDGSLDLNALDALVDAQLEAGIDGLIPCGTTGESVTLTAQEDDTVIARVVKRVAGRVPVLAGTGSNDTSTVIHNQKRARDLGAVAGLVVTPYYNKPTQEGLFKHYEKIATSVDFPIMLYNVPGRTGCDLKPETALRIAALPNIVGFKEATGDLDRLPPLRAGTSPSFSLLSGDDGTSCAFALLGGDGVISVASNLVPREMVAMIHAALRGDVATARTLHTQMHRLFGVLFVESNPIPIKASLALQNRIQEAYRLPLTPMSEHNKKTLAAVMREGGWL
jgi:4-hydroxy-tetrahydrodipicolinate synthase